MARPSPARIASYIGFSIPFIVFLAQPVLRAWIGEDVASVRGAMIAGHGIVLGLGILAGSYALLAGIGTGQKGVAIRGGIGFGMSAVFLVLIAMALLTPVAPPQ